VDVRKNRTKLPLDTKVPCAVCSFQEPLATAHDHHRKPRAFGGTDDSANRVWLCASCHTRLHRLQEFIAQGKTASAYDLCASIFPTQPKAREQLWTFANEAATSEKEVQEAFASHRENTVVNLSIEAELWAAVKARAKDRKTTATKLAVEFIRKAMENV
jgi:hypothetical protein